MSSNGDSCFPSVAQIIKFTGLGKTAVIKHLAIAVQTGWLTKKQRGFHGRAWRRTEYQLGWPPRDLDVEAHEGLASPSNENGVVHDTTQGRPPSEPGMVRAANCVIDQSIDQSSTTARNARAREALVLMRATPCDSDMISWEFDEAFWPRYPHKVGRTLALRLFHTARTRASLEAIIAGLERYIASKPIDRMWMNAATFLTEERWADEPGTEARHVPRYDRRRPVHDVLAAGFAAAIRDRKRQRSADVQPRPDGDRTAMDDAGSGGMSGISSAGDGESDPDCGPRAFAGVRESGAEQSGCEIEGRRLSDGSFGFPRLGDPEGLWLLDEAGVSRGEGQSCLRAESPATEEALRNSGCGSEAAREEVRGYPTSTIDRGSATDGGNSAEAHRAAQGRVGGSIGELVAGVASKSGPK